MQLHKKIPLVHQNKDYEVRILYENNMITAVAFLENRPANGYRHRSCYQKTVT